MWTKRIFPFVARQRRFVSVESIEKAVGRRAANHFIESMDLNSKHIVSHMTEYCCDATHLPLPPCSGYSSYMCIRPR